MQFCTEVLTAWMVRSPGLFVLRVEAQRGSRFRPKAVLQNLLRAAGAHHLNPIELAFSKLKALLLANANRTVHALWKALGDLCDNFSPGECANYFRHDGYCQSA